MSDAVHIIACGDRNVLQGMAVSVRSALEFASCPLAITIVGSGLTKADHKNLRDSWADHPKTASITIHDLDYDKVKSFRSTGYLKSKITYARFFVDDFIPEASRCVYLDSDLIVLRDVCELAAIDLEGNVIAAALDISTRANGGQIEICQKLGIRDPQKYFNAGVLVVDLDRYRREKIQQTLVDVSIEMFDKLDVQDQSAFNVVLQDSVKIIPHLWNTVQYETDENFKDGIVHLIGHVKPWHPDYDYKFADLFFHYLDMTAYKGKRPMSLGGAAALQAKLGRAIPTRDMIVGKLRRMLNR